VFASSDVVKQRRPCQRSRCVAQTAP